MRPALFCKPAKVLRLFLILIFIVNQIVVFVIVIFVIIIIVVIFFFVVVQIIVLVVIIIEIIVVVEVVIVVVLIIVIGGPQGLGLDQLPVSKIGPNDASRTAADRNNPVAHITIFLSVRGIACKTRLRAAQL